MAPSPSRSAVRSASVGSIEAPSPVATRSGWTSRPSDWSSRTGSSGVSSMSTVLTSRGSSHSSAASSVVLPAPRAPARRIAAPRATATERNAAVSGASVPFSTRSGSRKADSSWARNVKPTPSLTGEVTPATRTRRSPASAVAASVGLAREKARPLERRNRDARASAPSVVSRTFVRRVWPSCRTRIRFSSTGAVRKASVTAGSARGRDASDQRPADDGRRRRARVAVPAIQRPRVLPGQSDARRDGRRR